MAAVSEAVATIPDPALESADWADCWQVTVSSPFANAREAAEAIIRAFPVWTNSLLALRQILVLPLGLKGAGARHEATDQIGIFPIVEQSRDRLVAGFDDKHLDFRLLVSLSETADGQRISLTTLIARHNLSGRLYLQAVLPFHRAIIRSALKRIRNRS